MLRAIYFDRQSRPEDLFGGRRPARRAGDQDLAERPRWRVVYALLEATRADVRLVVVLAVGRAHTAPGQDDVHPAHLAELRDGGAIIVLSDDRQAVLGVLTRDPAVFGDAQIAQQIEDGHLPPLEELLAMDDRSETR